jgi:hypothetical protein
MQDISITLWQLGFSSIGILMAVSSCCLCAIVTAATKRKLRDMR